MTDKTCIAHNIQSADQAIEANTYSLIDVPRFESEGAVLQVRSVKHGCTRQAELFKLDESSQEA